MNNSALNDEIEKDVLPWLRLAEDLRVLQLDVEICVMGDQSSGKSSVLEALSGIPFPRGAGLVTRCPIRMVMKKARAGESWSAVLSTTLNPEEKQHAKDIPQLSLIMNKLMQKLCVDDVNFSTESVVVELVSPDASDLTVVDLPGIIRTVTSGQNIQCIEQVNRLIKSCLLDERTIILAVIPANQDVATVDILERAEGVDPTGQRTIGVLTKCDLIGPGAEDEVLEVVNNRRKPLALGYTMVKNRSQKDIKDGISSAKARENELAFFGGHPAFRGLNPSLYGVEQLSKKLTNVLVSKIKQELIPMKQIVERKLNEVRAQLRALPKAFTPPKNTADRQKLLVAIMQQYLRYLSDCIRGEYWDRVLVRHPELRMYNTVVKKFEIFQAQIAGSAPQFKEKDFIDNLTMQIKQLRGRELPGFMSQQAFFMCMAQYIDLWQEPMQELVQDVHSVALDVSVKLAEILFVQYPGLRDGIKAVTERALATMAEETSTKLSSILTKEKDPFTLNMFLPQWVNKLRYDRFKAAVEEVFEECVSSSYATVKEETFCGIRDWYKATHSVAPAASAADMAEIMEAYWNLSSKRFIDNCCMMADSDLLGDLPARIQDEMYNFLGDEAQLEEFFIEDPTLAATKTEAESLRDRLMIAFSRLNALSVEANAAKALADSKAAALAKVASMNANAAAAASVAVPGTPNSEVATGDKKPESGEAGEQELEFTVPIGELGIGLVIVHDSNSSHVVIKGFRAMPYKKENPAQAAGLRVNDRIKSINGRTLADHNHAVNLIRSAQGEIKLVVIRRGNA